MILKFCQRVLLGAFLSFSMYTYAINKPYVAISFEVKSIICPQLCKGEKYYKIIFTSSEADSITSSSGIVKNDTISDIDPSTNYQVIVTLFNKNGERIEKLVLLPTCTPLIPPPPLVANQTSCITEPVPTLIAQTNDDSTTVDWYATPTSSLPIAKGTKTFSPSSAGTYYAVSRVEATGCTSLIRASASVEIIKTLCSIVLIKKISR